MWDFSVKLKKDLALKFVEKVCGVSDIVKSEQDVTAAKEAYGGFGARATVPILRKKQRLLQYWVRGHTGMLGTHYGYHEFQFPNKKLKEKKPTDL